MAGARVKIGGRGVVPYDPSIEILFVCTGNICRSPMAEALVGRRARALDPGTIVQSTGFRFDGRPAEPGAVAALAKLGLDLRPHRSSIVAPEMLAQADLVLAMENAHVRDLAGLDGADFAKIFTFPDAVARAEAMGPRGDEPLATWITRMGAGRSIAEVLAHRPDLEVPDPMGGSKRAFRASAAQIDDLAERFVAMALAPPDPDDPTYLAHHPTLGST